MAIGAAKTWGAKKIFAVDVFDAKLEVAKAMGANMIFNSKNSDAVKAVKDATDGVGADIVIDYTGNGRAILDGFASLRKGGKMVLVGLPSKDLTINLSDNIIYKEATVIGVTGRLMYETWEECEQLLATPVSASTPLWEASIRSKSTRKHLKPCFRASPAR